MNQQLSWAFALFFLVACSEPHDQWQSQETPTRERLRAVSVVDDQTVWASGNHGTCLRTRDGGNTWARIAVPDADSLDFRDVEAISADTALLLSIGPGSLSRIYRTTTAGRSWKITFTNHDTAAFYDAMTFADPLHGVAFSDAVSGKLAVIRTHDGGRTWITVDSNAIPSAMPGEGGFAASGTCIVSLGSRVWIGTGVNIARVYRSLDHGKTWTVTVIPVEARTTTSGIFSVAFYDSLQGIAIGGDYRKENVGFAGVALTSDGGKTWNAITGSPPVGFRSVVAWLSKNSLMAVGPGGSDVSIDGGNSWTTIDTVGFHGADSAPSGKFVWVVGEVGQISRWSVPDSLTSYRRE